MNPIGKTYTQAYNLNSTSSLEWGLTARMLSPDPFVQNTTSTQNFNRYSYFMNNPLKYTDPSGYYYMPDGTWIDPWIDDDKYSADKFAWEVEHMNPDGSYKVPKSAWQGVCDVANGKVTIEIKDKGIMFYTETFRKIGEQTEIIGADGNKQVMLPAFERILTEYYFKFPEGFDFFSNAIATMAGLKYTSSNAFREGYWRGVNGEYYSMSKTIKGTKGWVIYKRSADIAKKSFISSLGRVVNYVSFFNSGIKFIDEQNWSNGIDLGVNAVGIVFWEFSVAYFLGKTFYELTLENTNYLINNGDNPGKQFIINKE